MLSRLASMHSAALLALSASAPVTARIRAAIADALDAVRR